MKISFTTNSDDDPNAAKLLMLASDFHVALSNISEAIRSFRKHSFDDELDVEKLTDRVDKLLDAISEDIWESGYHFID
jgi:phosphate uptake regulator